MYEKHFYDKDFYVAKLQIVLFQDEKASYDVNGHDPDPTPRYDYTNENRYFYIVLLNTLTL